MMKKGDRYISSAVAGLLDRSPFMLAYPFRIPFPEEDNLLVCKIFSLGMVEERLQLPDDAVRCVEVLNFQECLCVLDIYCLAAEGAELEPLEMINVGKGPAPRAADHQVHRMGDRSLRSNRFRWVYIRFPGVPGKDV